MARRVCTIDDCDKPREGRGLCGKHYARLLRHGDPHYTQRPTWGMSAWDRFWLKVDASGDCWQWTAGSKGKDYGGFDSQWAHRWAWEHLVGPIPDGLDLDHLCRNRGCVNPDHLEPVPVEVNVLRGFGAMALNARKTHCPKGHPYSGDNVRIYARPGGKPSRYCVACSRTSAESERGRVA
jgi:hypothetical protein